MTLIYNYCKLYKILKQRESLLNIDVQIMYLYRITYLTNGYDTSGLTVF